MEYLFPFYMCLNCFVAGMYFHSMIDDRDLGWKFFGVLLIAIFFGTFIVIGLLLKEILKHTFKPLQLQFFYDFYFTDRFRNITEEFADTAAKGRDEYWTSNSITHRLSRLGARLVIERFQMEQLNKAQ